MWNLQYLWYIQVQMRCFQLDKRREDLGLVCVVVSDLDLDQIAQAQARSLVTPILRICPLRNTLFPRGKDTHGPSSHILAPCSQPHIWVFPSQSVVRVPWTCNRKTPVLCYSHNSKENCLFYYSKTILSV